MNERELQRKMAMAVIGLSLLVAGLVFAGYGPAFVMPWNQIPTPTAQILQGWHSSAPSCQPGPYGCGTEYGKGPVLNSSRGGG